ncbi:MAG TPA: hypothetical protein VF032_04490 [Thermoleophilaceae bacterium]
MSFAAAWTIGVVVVLLFIVALGRFSKASPRQFLDWKPARSYEDGVRLELEDIDQMLEAQNERRRRSGRPELSEDDVRAQVDAAQREQKTRADDYRGRERTDG